MSHRSEGAGTADLDLDVLDNGGGLLGWKFVSRGPADLFGGAAEFFLIVQMVDFEDDAVYFVW